ncbi:MAG: Trm112 family protein [Piscirickettsiaceae bacterium]|nr:Trm112 family protein [Piscirickettsiaceae bacterium]
MDKSLLEILACPSCKGNLDYDSPQQELICLNCMLAYPIRDDIPIMLIEKARKVDTDAKL